jgi:pyruvate dehydrogenase E1 component alpha subunit/2-oxoisovalerate dehydrogenase E1 component alpha subunit
MAGVALASKLTGKGIVALTYIGDGGTSTTDFHEGLNFASVQRVPMVLVIENNGWAYSTPTRRQTAVPEFINRARAYGIRGYQVDGNEVISVYDATRLALEHCRKGDGPVLIEAMTMRMRGHAEHDSAWYVPKDELEQWKDRDPIELFERHLFESGSITESERDNIVARVRNEVDRAVELTEQSSFPPEEIARGGVYHESN